MKKNKVKIKGKLRTYLMASVYLGLLLVTVTLLIYLINIPAGFVLTCFDVFYFIIIFILLLKSRPAVINDLVRFAAEYKRVQEALLDELELPYALLDESGKLLWANQALGKIVQKDWVYGKSVTSVFSSITQDKLPEEIPETDIKIQYEGKDYLARLKKVSLKDIAKNNNFFEIKEYDGFVITMYLFDETALNIALQEVDDQSLAVGLLYLDNYEEALESVEEVRRSLLIALIDRKVNKYIASLDGICKKLEKDKYFVVLRKKSIEQFKEHRFDLLEDVKTVNIGNEMAVTISIGIGLDGLSYSQNYEFSRNAIDLALGRGGDQAVVKTPEAILYYGGKSQQVEKNTRVKARVKGQALKEIISSKEKVFIMGHRIGDVDSFGSAIGIYRIAKTLEKRAHIVLNEVTTSIQPLVDFFKDNPEYENDMIITGQQALELVGGNSVLVVVDVNKPSITECPDLLRYCKSIVVLDHHRQGTEVIENATLSYVEAYASSACEMVSEILQYIGDGIKIKSEEADCLYSGILLDTNNFMTKTGVRTFEAAAFLRRSGADVTRVRKLFRENANEYKAKADAVSQAEIYHGCYAISTCTSEDIQSPTIVGAQAANELLNIKGVKASFVLTEYQNYIFVSARSIDEVNVQIIVERMGGGGHMNSAGVQLEGISLAEGIGIVKSTIDKMITEGHLADA